MRLLRRVGIANPESLDDYRAHGGYEALARAFALGPAGVIREVTDSRLVGRGGALFPTGRKWDAVSRAAARLFSATASVSTLRSCSRKRFCSTNPS